MLNNPVTNIDPTGHRTCSAEQSATGDETCNQNISNDFPMILIFPKAPPNIEGRDVFLLTPDGNGKLSWYDFPMINSDINDANDLPNQGYLRMQGSVKLNGVTWNYNKYTGRWEKNSRSCSPPYASSTQCVVPYNDRAPDQVTTAAVSRNSSIPMGPDQYIYIQIPDANIDPKEIMVNTRDECPGCDRMQVDILAVEPLKSYFSYNTPNGLPANVYIWIYYIPSDPHIGPYE